MRALLLVNRHARRGHDQLLAAVAHLEELGFALREESSAHPDTLPELIRGHLGRVDCVIVGGGDGTLSAAANGLAGTGCPLGILPLGTANNLARTLGIPLDLREACDVIAAGHRRAIDLGQVDGRYFLTTASIGLSVAITRELSAERKRRWGVLAYGLAALKVLGAVRPFRAEIRWPGGTVQARSVQIVIGNGRYYGSGLAVAEDAAIDDQWLDLYSIELSSWWRLLGLVPALKLGRQGERRGVRTIRAREFEIVTSSPRRIDMDGEIGGRTPAVFRVVAGGMSVFVRAGEGCT